MKSLTDLFCLISRAVTLKLFSIWKKNIQAPREMEESVECEMVVPVYLNLEAKSNGRNKNIH